MAVVATKFDLLCPRIQGNVKHLYKCKKANDAVEQISERYGVPKSHVFPVVNYVSEKASDVEKNQLALLAIRDVCKLTEGYLSHHEGKQLF